MSQEYTDTDLPTGSVAEQDIATDPARIAKLWVAATEP